ncbi:Gfo/Idh/MocA family protein [Steroidobacter sp.]|uniref:Gfo/Idh/MocA family protein n=1 Tax=Steroidobacter sp. TaxID=1978227 RepID=UPI001A52846B|nr:Gfo/Idh/MocA family oxidoreductase [Steroidobacter sp.]MBL8270848.1 Gfo/Idh/MocA family oxidoreductase [Steroidobacter sp.]
MAHTLRIGILGAARIAASFVAGARQSARVDVVAVASRDVARAEVFAQTHQIARALTYEQMLASPEVDAVYIPLPNSLHAPWSIAAARAGKHVLCEKPLALSEEEALGMFAAADAAGVVLLEGYPFLFQPQTLEIERLVAAGTLGRVQTIFAACGFTLSNPDDIRFDPALGGGALLDAGCYPVSFIRQLTGTRPVRVSASARWQRGVDETLTATLEFANGIIAQLSCSFASGLHRTALITCSGGIIETDYSNHTARSSAPHFRLRRGSDWRNETEIVPVPREDGFRAEVDAFAEMIADPGSESLAARRAASLDNAWTLAAILAAARG